MAFSRILLRLTVLLAIVGPVTGCLAPLHKQAIALQSAATPVVAQASAAYQSANALYDLSVDAKAVTSFNRKDPVYNPRTETDVLLPEKDIAIRLKVLEAFQLYVATLVEITNGISSPGLDAASTAVGTDLTKLSNDVAPAFESRFGITGVAADPVSPMVRNVISTAANALGQFLTNRAIKKDLPGIISKMDPQVKTLCELLESDVDMLQDQQNREYDGLIDGQRTFILTQQLSAEERRNEIMKLPEIVRRERLADTQLTALRASIVRLYLTHHALAEQAVGNDQETYIARLKELAAAGSSLGAYYSSLPTS